MKGSLMFAQDEFHYVTILCLTEWKRYRVTRSAYDSSRTHADICVNLISRGKYINHNELEYTEHIKRGVLKGT